MSAHSRVMDAARLLAKQPNGFDNRELAAAAHIEPSVASGHIQKLVAGEVVFKGGATRQGVKGRYFDTKERADAWAGTNANAAALVGAEGGAVARARAAVDYIARKGLASTAGLQVFLGLEAADIDAALDPLVRAQRLVRVTVMREGVSMFDYRLSATWTPKDEDFEVCRTAGPVPLASLSPIKPPAQTKTSPQIRVARSSHPPSGEERKESGAIGGRSRADAVALDQVTQTAASLGWSVRPATSPAAAETVLPQDREVIEVTDLVAALNSKGELALDIGDGRVVKFRPEHSLELSQFMAGTCTWLTARSVA